MRAQAVALSVLLATTTRAVRADDIPNLSGSWKLVGVSVGRDTKAVPPDHVLAVRQQGPDVTMETVVNGGASRVITFTIGARKPTTDRYGMETKGRVEKQALILEEKSSRPCGIENFFADTYQERRTNGDGSASRRAMLSYPIAPICVNPVRRSTYRMSDDGATLEVMKPGELRWQFKRQ